MEEAEIVRIERTLGYSLPGEYRYFLWRHTDEVREIEELLEFRAVLWTDADDIIAGNRDLDKQADVMLVGDEPWPDTFFLVGTNGGGDYWFVDRTGARRGVWFWQHEAQEIDKRHDSFEDYMEALRSDARDPKKWQGPFG